MTNKELNITILAKLYEIAEQVWQKMVRTESGSFRASEIVKGLYDTILWGDDIDVNEPCKVDVDSFSCGFRLGGVFHFIAKFEALAGVGKKAHLFVYEKESKGELGCVMFQANKAMAELCGFVDAKNLLPSMSCIYIDAKKNRLVACEGHKMLIMPISITYQEGDTKDMLINAKIWKKMCSKMKEGQSCEVRAVKLDNHDQATQTVCEDLISYVPYNRPYPNYAGAFCKVSDSLCVRIGESWSDIKKFIYANPGDEEFVFLTGKRGENVLTVKVGENAATFSVGELQHSFNICFGRETIMTPSYIDTIYLTENASAPKAMTGKDGNIYLLCAHKNVDEYVGEIENGACYLDGVTFDKDLLQTASEITEKSEKAETASKVEAIAAKNVTISKNTVTSKQAKSSVKDSRKFSFEAIGIKPGTLITFIHGGELVATTEDNKVRYMGETYTLSGFCKEFMPANKRNKAESYRGCAFFTYQGVKLEKMFKEVLKKNEAEEVEEVKNVPAAIDNVSDVIDSNPAMIDSTTDSHPAVIDSHPAKIDNALAAKFVRLEVSPIIETTSKVTTEVTTETTTNKDRQEISSLRPRCAPVGSLNCAVGTSVLLAGCKPVGARKTAYGMCVIHELSLPPPHIGSG